MTHTAPSLRFLLRLCALFLLSAFALTPHASAAYQSEQSITTRYFTIFYPEGEETTAKWYASFADDVDAAVSDLLGAQPVQDLTLRIYASEPDYWKANPMSQIHAGILAHAIPEQKEVGVAVERLRQQAPELARESFRHEMTHVVAGALSAQNLPIGFQEGLAQYNELSDTRSAEVVQALQAAQSTKAPLLPWTDLNDTDKFRQKLNVSYPESYTVMAFLADRYGMGAFSRFMGELNRNIEYKQALFTAYGQPIDVLETQWRSYLPQFLKEGWKTNILNAHDLASGIALYNAGRFQDAQEHFARSERLYNDLGRKEKAAQAADYRNKAEQAGKGDDTAHKARQALEAHNYAEAQQSASKAVQTFSSLNLAANRQAAQETEDLADRGLDGVAALDRSRGGFEPLRIVEAQTDIRQAGETFALLGDAPRVEETNKILQDMWLWQRTAGLVALGLGIAAVLMGTLATLRSRRRASRLRRPVYLQEEPASWL